MIVVRVKSVTGRSEMTVESIALLICLRDNASRPTEGSVVSAHVVLLVKRRGMQIKNSALD